jgi:hypothetical protein
MNDCQPVCVIDLTRQAQTGTDATMEIISAETAASAELS